MTWERVSQYEIVMVRGATVNRRGMKLSGRSRFNSTVEIPCQEASALKGRCNPEPKDQKTSYQQLLNKNLQGVKTRWVLNS